MPTKSMELNEKETSMVTLKANTALRRAVEARQIEKQRGWTYKEKIQKWSVQPADEATLRQIKKTEAFRGLNDLWNTKHYVGEAAVGSLMEFIRVNIPKTRDEFCEMYFEEFPYISFFFHARKIADECRTDFQDELNHLYIRTIIETWDGYENELIVFNLLKAKYVDTGEYDDIRFATADEDRSYAVDILLLKDGIVALAVQVKPASYFYKGYLDTKARNKKKNLAYTVKTGAEVVYVSTAVAAKGVIDFYSIARLDRIYGFTPEQTFAPSALIAA